MQVFIMAAGRLQVIYIYGRLETRRAFQFDSGRLHILVSVILVDLKIFIWPI